MPKKTTRKPKRMPLIPMNFSWPEDWVARIDEMRMDVPEGEKPLQFREFVRELVYQAINTDSARPLSAPPRPGRPWD